MLHLKNIAKDYQVGSTKVEALRGVNVVFRESEFVTILGPSGCGKTTMLNIIGGLDRYSAGDVVISGKSTKDFSDRDWDTYRNRSVGFVFQNYNLIPHQTVLRNVELAMTLSGVGLRERRHRAAAVLARVGLADQVYKKPNQLSGGQMQRVAIARALVNNPDILLADEPTGALDSETSVQIMEILKEIAEDRLVIMVTHNQDLAHRYATRVIRLLDGLVTDDSDPYSDDAIDASQKRRHYEGRTRYKPPMSFFTALSLSLNNLMTKKTRTFLTAFAGSIGIIGIALILALSTGFQRYINRIQEDTLSTYPIVISETARDLDLLLTAIGDNMESEHSREIEPGIVYSHNMMGAMVNSMVRGTESNDLKSFKRYLEKNMAAIEPLVNAVAYGYGINLNLYKPDAGEGVVRVSPMPVSDHLEQSFSMAQEFPMGPMGRAAFSEMIDNEALLRAQYEVVAGKWPERLEEMVLVISDRNELHDMALYSLGLSDPAEFDEMMRAVAVGGMFDVPERQFTYEELLDLRYRFVPSAALYVPGDKMGGYVDMRDDEEYMKELIADAMELRIVGILRKAPDAQSASITTTVGYTRALTEHIIALTNESEIVKAQLANPGINVFTGAPFGEAPKPVLPDFALSLLPPEMQAMVQNMSEDDLNRMVQQYMPQRQAETASFEENLRLLGVIAEDTPSSISLYPIDFESKDTLDAFIREYNRRVQDAGNDHQMITYTDFIGLMISSVSTIISAISYVLIAFVAISLVVSSIMIGIITYVSVLERTKEIGILKSIGASRRDISLVFNAETLIVGLVAGVIGIGTTLLLTIPINLVIQSVVYVAGLAKLPPMGGAVLVGLSMFLTLVAGLIPAKVAARKDPVVALRSE